MKEENRVLQAFEWPIEVIIKNLEMIAKQGFTSIQTSPLQPLKETKTAWWLLYQPCGFTIGNELGSKSELIELCNKAKEYNIRIIVDVVCNHVANKQDDLLAPHEKVDKILLSDPHFWKEKKYVFNWNDRYEVIHHCIGLPSLNLSNYNLQDIVIQFLNELIDCNVGGFRFDAAKHIGLPEEGNVFWKRVLENLKHKETLFNYAEVIFADKELIDKYCKYINVLTDGFGSDKNKLVTFIESHDTYYEFGYTKNMTDEMLIREYRVLTENFNNTLFYSRPWSKLWRSEEIRNIHLKERR